MNNIEMETTRFEVSVNAKAMKVTEAARHALGDLEDAVNGFHSGIGEAGFHECQDTLPVRCEGARELAEWLQAAAVRPCAPSAQPLFCAPREHALEALARADAAAEDRIIPGEALAIVEMFLGAGPRVAPDRPEAACEIGPGGGQIFANPVQRVTSQLHDVKQIEDNAGFGKRPLGNGDEGGAHVHNDLGDLVGIGPVFGHFAGELLQGVATAAIDHEQQIVAVGIKNDGDITVAATGAGFIHHDAGDFRPILLLVGLCDVVIEHPPKPGVVLPEMAGCRLHAHLPAEKQDHGFHHQRKTAAFPGPRNFGEQNPVFVALGARHSCDEKGLVLPEVEMPPLLFHRVMDRAPLPALRTRKARSLFEIQPQTQPTPFDIHLAFDHFPSAPEPESHPEQIVGVHSREILHARTRSASPSFRWPKALFNVPLERLPRRAVPGLGAHSPQQTSSFHPFNSARSPFAPALNQMGKT